MQAIFSSFQFVTSEEHISQNSRGILTACERYYLPFRLNEVAVIIDANAVRIFGSAWAAGSSNFHKQRVTHWQTLTRNFHIHLLYSSFSFHRIFSVQKWKRNYESCPNCAVRRENVDSIRSAVLTIKIHAVLLRYSKKILSTSSVDHFGRNGTISFYSFWLGRIPNVPKFESQISIG